MIPLLIFIFVLNVEGKPIKGAAVTCEGFLNYNVDEGATTEPMISDSRGAVVLQTVGEQTTTCYVFKDGYRRWAGDIVMDATHLKSYVTLKR